ncbi:MAG: M50 family metallopeptidase [Stackebrandtia sp.]
MAYVIGIILFAAAILASVSLHEAGHMGTAKAFGMRVTRYFLGFGPTLWSFRKGETEYGVKAVPLGGFVKITGMTEQDEAEEQLDEKDKKRVFWRKPLWQRTVVLAAGSVVHFILGFIILWIMASFVGAPNPAYADEVVQTSKVTVLDCLSSDPGGECADDDPESPASAAGLRDGDQIVAINGRQIAGETCAIDSSSVMPATAWDCVVLEIRELEAGEEAEFTVSRDGKTWDVAIAPELNEVPTADGGTQQVAQIGISRHVDPTIDSEIVYGPVDGIGGAASWTGDVAVQIGKAIPKIPQKIPAVWNSIFGAERDPETPVSVVGASRLGGEMVERDMWPSFFLLLAILNYFIGVFNLLPLLPMDGGHIAIAWYEKARSGVARLRKKPDPGRVDYMKLMPLTYTVIVILIGFTLLLVTADVVNPITLP